MKRILLVMVAAIATTFAASAQMATARKTTPIIKCAELTEMTVQHAYATVCNLSGYVKLSDGLIKSVAKVGKSEDLVDVTLANGKKYTFNVVPNTNYNTLSFSVESPKEYSGIGFIIIVDEVGGNAKITIGASGTGSKSTLNDAKTVMEPIFKALLNGFKSI